MEENFYAKYNCYDNYQISNLVHIPEKSVYNKNYYYGVIREGETSADLILAESDESSGTTEFYHVDNDNLIHIGYAYDIDDNINLEQ